MSGITKNLGLSSSTLPYRRRYGLSQHTAKCCGIEIRRVGTREGEDRHGTFKCCQGKPHRIIVKEMYMNGRIET